MVRQCVIAIQSLYRRMKAKRQVFTLRNLTCAAVVIQRMGRGLIQRPRYRKALEHKKNQANLSYQLELLRQQMLEDEERRRIEYEREQEIARKQLEEDMALQLQKIKQQVAAEEKRRAEEFDRQQKLVQKKMDEERHQKLEEHRLAKELEMMKQKMVRDEEQRKIELGREQKLVRRKIEDDAALLLRQMKQQMVENEERRKIEYEQEQEHSRKKMEAERLQKFEDERLEMQQQLHSLRAENELLEIKNEAAQLAVEAAAMNQLLTAEQHSIDGKSRSASPHSVVEPEVQIVEVIKYVEKETNRDSKLTEEQQGLMEESGKIIEFLRNENVKLKKRVDLQKKDFSTLKENNQRLMEANSSAGASFASLNQHAKQLNASNQKLLKSVANYRGRITQLHTDMKRRQTYYREIADTYKVEAEVRIFYEKAFLDIVDAVSAGSDHQQSCDPAVYQLIMSKAISCAKMSQKLTGADGDASTVMNEPLPPISIVEVYQEDELDDTMVCI
jgi:hypothetical protein